MNNVDGTYGLRNSVELGEVTNRQRQMGGVFLGAGYKTSPSVSSSQSSDYTAPSPGAYTADPYRDWQAGPTRVPGFYDVTNWNGFWDSFCGFGPTVNDPGQPTFGTSSCG
jgi:hypothetical protein